MGGAALAAALLAAWPAQPAHAVEPFVELHAGVQDPHSDLDTYEDLAAGRLLRLDEPGAVYGIRAGASWRRVTLSALATRYELTRHAGIVRRESFMLQRNMALIEAGWIFLDRERVGLVLLGGVGQTTMRATDGQEWESRTRLTYQVGLGATVKLGRRFYLRPEIRAHDYDGKGDERDWEMTVGAGLVLGRINTAP
jgi:hypothetical protein